MLQRPRDAPTRTAFLAAVVTVYGLLWAAGGNDILADQFHLSINELTYLFRTLLFVLPPLAYWVTKRICLGLQQRDRDRVLHGRETGIILRLPHGEFVEVHQPLAGIDEHGHPRVLPYQGAPAPKKMNALGAAGAPLQGGWFRPDPADEQDTAGAGGDPLEVEPDFQQLAGRPAPPTD